MKFAAVYRERLAQPPFSDAPFEAIGAWTLLLAAAANLERDTLPFSPETSERTLMTMAGVTRAALDAAVSAGLCEVVRDGILVKFYDYDGQRAVEQRRKNGREGGRKTKTTGSNGKNNLASSGAEPAGYRPGRRDLTRTEPPSLPLPSSPLLSLPENAPSRTIAARAQPTDKPPLQLLSGVGDPEIVPRAPPVLTFPCNGRPAEWRLERTQVLTWEGLYPGVDVEREARKALAWVLANKAKAKTARGMPRFLVNWLGNSNDRGRRGPTSNGVAVGHARVSQHHSTGEQVR